MLVMGKYRGSAHEGFTDANDAGRYLSEIAGRGSPSRESWQRAIRDGFPAHAAAIYGSPTDFFSLFDQYPDQYEGIADQLWPDWRTNRPSVLGRRSAITWAEEIDVPILIMHGANDQSMPVTQSLSFAKRLSELGKVFELHVVGYENHMISGHAGKRDALAIAWYEKHSGEKSSRN
jgi:pimeloyl-ACP methyl ester carboxylesterase